MSRRVAGCALLLALLTACGPRLPDHRPAGQAGELAVTILVAEELAAVAPAITRAVGRAAGVKVTCVTTAAAQLGQQTAAGAADFVLSPGPDDLVGLDQQGLLMPGAGFTLAKSPLCWLSGPHGAVDPAHLEATTGPLGIPDATAGAVSEEARKQIKKAAPVGATPVLAPAPSAKLARLVADSQAKAALVPAYALWQPRGTVLSPTTWPSPVSNVMLVALRSAPHHFGQEQVLRVADKLDTKRIFRGTRLEPVVKETGHGRGPGLFVFAGAGIREPLEKAATAFTAQSGIPVRYTYTGSACLLAQITMSQSGDVYIPGEEYFMVQAADRKYITSQQRVAYFIPVIMTQKGNPKGLHTLQDLTRPGIKVGLGEPKSCAIGTFTVKLLTKLKLYDAIERNTVMHTALAAEMGTALKFGAIDACINWDAVAAWFEKSADIVPIPPDQNESTAILAGVLKFSKQAAAAQSFVAFLAGREGHTVFQAARYTVDPQHPIFPVGGKP